VRFLEVAVLVVQIAKHDSHGSLRGARDHSTVEAVDVARQQSPDSARAAADKVQIALRCAGEMVVDDAAGIAAARPIAVASSASAMPGATTARLVVCAFEIPMKLFMIPHTVRTDPRTARLLRWSR